MNNNLLKILLFYFSLFFVLPFFLHLSFKDAFKYLYRDTGAFECLVFIVLILVFFIFSFNKRIKKKTFLVALPNILFNKKILFFLSIIFLIISIYFSINFSIKFRHKGEHLTDAGGIIILLTGLRSLFKAHLFISFIYQLKFKKKLNSKILYFIIALSFWFSRVSSLDIALIFISLILAFNKVSFLTSEGATKFKLFNNVYLRFATLFFVAILTVFMGVANKIGYDKALSTFSDKENVSLLVLSTGLRFSTYYASVFGAYTSYEKEKETIKQAIPGTVQNTFNRFTFLTTGKSGKKPRYFSVYRSNYKNLFLDNNNPRTGASPGIVASIFYFNNLFLGVIIIGFYIFLIIKFLKETFDLNSQKLNMLGVFISFVFVIPYFESPIDYINIFNPAFIYFYFTFVSLKKVNYEKSHQTISV